MTRRLVRRVTAPPPHYVPPAPRYEPPPKRRNKVRVARVVVFEQHIEFSLLGFEIEDLDNLKELIGMRWDRDDRVWITHRRNLHSLTEALQDNGFIVRERRVSD